MANDHARAKPPASRPRKPGSRKLSADSTHAVTPRSPVTGPESGGVPGESLRSHPVEDPSPVIWFVD